MHMRTFFAIKISFMPTVMQYSGMPVRSPPQFMKALIVRVSREMRSTRVGRAMNCSFVQASPGSGGSLKAKCPFTPTPPQAMSSLPYSRILSSTRCSLPGSGNRRFSGSTFSSGSIRL